MKNKMESLLKYHKICLYLDLNLAMKANFRTDTSCALSLSFRMTDVQLSLVTRTEVTVSTISLYSLYTPLPSLIFEDYIVTSHWLRAHRFLRLYHSS